MAQEDLAQVALVEELARRLLGLPTARDAPAGSSGDDRLSRSMRIALRILGSQLNAPVSQGDELLVRDEIRRRIALAVPRPANERAAVVRFQDLYRRLVAVDVLRSRWAVLYLLCSLSRPAQGVAEAPAAPATLFANPTLRLPEADDNRARRIAALQENSGGSGTRGSRNVGTGTASAAAASGAAAPRWAATAPTLSEHALLRDILFAFQGINGKCVAFDPAAGTFVIGQPDAPAGGGAADGDSAAVPPPPQRMPVAWRDAMLRLCELGWLFRRVAIYLKNDGAVLGSGGGGGGGGDGLVRQAFAAALQEELTDYYRLIAVLEGQLNSNSDSASHAAAQPLGPAAAGAGAAASEFSTAAGSGNTIAPGLTLLRLGVWATEPLERMKLMAAVVDGVGHLRGGALVGCLHAYTRHGDPAVRGFVRRLVGLVCQPLFGAVGRWVFEGELHDPCREFFVASNDAVANDVMWQQRYFVDKSMLPCFIPPSLANKILVIGKAINFMHACCGDTEWIMGTMAAAAEIAASAETAETAETAAGIAAGRGGAAMALEYGSLEGLRAVVERCSQLTNARVMWLMTERFGLWRHLTALKKFMLLGQGDFVTCLMDQLGPQLAARASKIYRHNLSGIVDSALRSSNAQYEPTDVLDRVGVRLLEPEGGDDGWKVFVLDYVLESPVTAVVHARATMNYRRMFQLLWSIKRAEWELSLAWSEHMSATHAGVERLAPYLRGAFHRCSLTRGQMVFFASNLGSYMMFEVLETSWTDLLARLADAKDLDAVISAHDDYLSIIMDKALLGDAATSGGPSGTGSNGYNGGRGGSGGGGGNGSGGRSLAVQLRLVLDEIVEFCDHQRTLVRAAQALLARQRAGAEAAAGRTRGGAWGYRAAAAAAAENDDASAAGSLTGNCAGGESGWDGGEAGGAEESREAQQRRFGGGVLERLDVSAAKYQAEFTTLMAMLEASSSGSEILRFLTFRLDFNHYYKGRAEAAALSPVFPFESDAAIF